MSKPIYFRLGSTGLIYQADSCRDFKVGIAWTDMVKVVDFNDYNSIHEDILSHRYFNKIGYKNSCGLYLVMRGDVLYQSIKDTKLARKMYPLAIEHEGWLLIENK